jgi:dihydrodipicolinate synthase/N-acetylneuraminate lyase
MRTPIDLSGVHVALTAPFKRGEGAVDVEALGQHVRWLLDNGIAGLVPNAPLGEYETLDGDERRAVVEAVAGARDGRGQLIVAISAPSWRMAGFHAIHAAEVGADAVTLLPPTGHAPTHGELLDHYRSVAQYGLPVVIHNDPSSVRIDLTPTIIADLAEIDGVVAVAEASGDVRRVTEIAELAPHLQLLCGTDDLALESVFMGATGWIGGFTGALPRQTVRLFELGRLGAVAEAVTLYRALVPLLRWSSGSRSVQAIKHTLDLLELPAGGSPRAPRRALDTQDRERIARQLEVARGSDPA